MTELHMTELHMTELHMTETPMTAKNPTLPRLRAVAAQVAAALVATTALAAPTAAPSRVPQTQPTPATQTKSSVAQPPTPACASPDSAQPLAQLDQVGICIDDRGRQIAVVRRGQRPPAGTDRVVVTNRRGEPLRSRRSVRYNQIVTKAGDSLRSIAYRYSVAPLVLATANDLQWNPDDVVLPAGMSLRVPIRYRAADTFGVAERLLSGPGVHSERRWSNWGRPHVVRLLANAFRESYKRWPQRHPAVAGSLSRLGGGKLHRHKSHRAGRDIDIGYYTTQSERTMWGRPALDAIDYERTWFLIDYLERTGQVAAIYMSPRIQVRLHAYALRQGADPKRLETLFQYPAAHGAKRTLIRYSRGHRDHLHMRFAHPADLEELSS